MAGREGKGVLRMRWDLGPPGDPSKTSRDPGCRIRVRVSSPPRTDVCVCVEPLTRGPDRL